MTPPGTPCDGPCLPVEIASDEGVADVAADESGVYWTALSTGDIRRADADGTNVVTLFDGDKGPDSIAIEATKVYWTEPNAGRVRAVRKDGSSSIAPDPWGHGA